MTSSCLQPIDRVNFLSDDKLDDCLHDWIVCVTGLDPTLVRPAWQPDPPPIPDFMCPCWVAFYVNKAINDYDAVVQHDLGMHYVTRQQQLEITTTFYGRDAGDTALKLLMGSWIPANRTILAQNGIALAYIHDQVTTSDMIKGRWQNRCDVDISLRRAVNWVFAVPDMGFDGPVCGSIIPEGPYQEIPWCVDKNSTAPHKGDC